MPDGNLMQSRARLGSRFETTSHYEVERVRKTRTYGLLDSACQLIELTETQAERAQRAYETVGEWLAGDPRLAKALIYVQGSVALGTTTKPLKRNDHDVDLICFIIGIGPDTPPWLVKKWIGDRLRAHATYAAMLEEKPRCWRLNYAGDFHLDITPAIANPHCQNGGELVPDKTNGKWKTSNPRGYRTLFERRAALTPMRRTIARVEGRVAKADLEPFPVQSAAKGILRRTVQLEKRHRDLDFLTGDPDMAPLSIILTTLSAQAYEWCVTHAAYDNELDLLCDTIRAMPWFIQSDVHEGARLWLVPNETTHGENFAEKWNADRARANAFFAWHERALADFEYLKTLAGFDEIERELARIIGEEPVRKAMASMVDTVTSHRKAGRLGVTASSGVGLVTALSTPVRANTFYGRQC